jgi:aspartate ammonia-lyase
MEGKFDDQFPIDVFHSGAGTSYHMNANEVIANRALELAGELKGSYEKISPNDHVNMAQSTNDVFPTALRVAALWMLERQLYPALDGLILVLDAKSREFDNIIKAGRTHLQDAVPIRLGQVFGGYAEAVRHALKTIQTAALELQRVNLGATAVGTGINAPKGYQALAVENLVKLTGLSLRPAENLVEITQSAADFCRMSAALRSLAVELIRIANDLRLLSSGPNTGFAELKLPAVQPGSSIMPGKVNPSIAEMVDMVGFQVIGNDTAITLAAQAGQLELNVMLPVVANNLLQSIKILANASKVFGEKCIKGIEADRERARRYAETSEALVTVLSPRIGYLAAAQIAKESAASGRSLREIILERGLIPEAELDALLDPYAMTE